MRSSKFNVRFKRFEENLWYDPDLALVFSREPIQTNQVELQEPSPLATSESGGLTGGEQAAIVIVVILVLLTLVGAVVFMRKRSAIDHERAAVE